jgi:hypothetical protein
MTVLTPGLWDLTTPDECDYFVMCRRPADGVIEHPRAGTVQVCERCAGVAGLPLQRSGDHDRR